MVKRATRVGSIVATNVDPRFRNRYFADAFSSPPAVDRPAVTLTVATASSDATAVLLREKRINNDTALGADLAGDPRFRYDGTFVMDPLQANPTTWVNAVLLPGGASQFAYYTPRIEFVTDPANKMVEIKLRSVSTAFQPRIVVNGNELAAECFNFTGLSAGANVVLKIAFDFAAARTIAVEIPGGSAFGGVWVANGQGVTRPVAAPVSRLAVLGDSFVGGTGSAPAPAGATRCETWARQVAKLRRVDSFWNFGVGGTGYTTANPFNDRTSAIVNCAPTEVIVFGSVNDGNKDVGSQVSTVLSSLSSIPSVYVVGPPRQSLPLAYASARSATLAAGRTFIDPGGEGWLDANVSRYIGSDNVHPTMAGHKRLATGVYEGILLATAI